MNPVAVGEAALGFLRRNPMTGAAAVPVPEPVTAGAL